jgi:hypothetical protein
MSYEDFLNLPISRIQEISKIIRFKRENEVPLSEEEVELRDHFIRYTQDLKLKEEKTRLEHFYKLDSYDKNK